MTAINNPKKSGSWENQIITCLKILLFAASLFILWSFLALISSKYHPFAGLEILFANETPSQTLADSLMSEILGSYFSIFTLVSFSFILTNGYFGYVRAKEISADLFTIFDQQKPICFLLNRIFINRKPKSIQIDSGRTRKFNHSRESILGPAVLEPEDPMAVLISQPGHGYRVLSSTSEKLITMTPDERLIKIIDPGVKVFKVMLKDITLGDKALSMRMDYQIRIPRRDEQRSNPHWIRNFNAESEKFQILIESLIGSQFSVFLKSRLDAQEKFKQETASEIVVDEKKIAHYKYTHIPFLKSRGKRSYSILRNRKRLIFPRGSMIVSRPEEGSQQENSNTMLDDWMADFLPQLKISLFQLFGYNPIEIINYQLGDS